MSLIFRWLGVAGVELRAGQQVLAIDPFFTRPSLGGFLRPVHSSIKLVAEKLPACNYVLVTHSHWDHVMDIPEVVRHTGAQVFGSANTCQLLRLHAVSEAGVSEVHIGDQLLLGAFKVEVIGGQHSWIPFSQVFNGDLSPGLQPPLRLQDYRMDVCLGYCIGVMGMRVLICAAQPRPAEVLFINAQESQEYSTRLFQEVRPHTVIPIHWDNFIRPLSKPLQRLTRPGRIPLWQLTNMARNILPHAKVLIPEIFKQYTLPIPEE